MDRRLVISVCAGVLALGAGVTAEVVNMPALALVAGILGLAGAVAAAGIAARAHTTEQQLHELSVDRARLRRELDALAAIFAEEATRRWAQGEEQAAHPSSGRLEPVVDPVSGLLDHQLFTVMVQQRVAAARRQLQPVSVVIFELDGIDGEPEDVRDQAMGIMGDVVRRTLRECDTTCRLGDSMAAAVLEDTAEAGAVWAAERVRGTLHGSPVGDSLTISAGIACYPSHALSASELVDAAGRALDAARARGRDHVEIAQLD